jgi:putative addiction module component (TIGR02574 family)
MTDATKTLAAQARKLTPEERLELVDDLLNSLLGPDKEMDRLWANEAAERWAAYQRGEIKALPLEEVLAKFRAK